MEFTVADIAGMIDYALLSPSLTRETLDRGCEEAIDLEVASVCILPYTLRRCASILAGTAVLPGTVIGFPHGAHATAVKRAEVRKALSDGAAEVDMVVNISQVRSGDWAYVRRDIAAVQHPAQDAGARVKVIFENAYLNREEKIRLCSLCGDLGVDWVKTSTGFAPYGATLEDVKLMVDHTPSPVQVKAAGGIRDLDFILAVRALGVTRVGCSRSAEILAECKRRIEQGTARSAAGEPA